MGNYVAGAGHMAHLVRQVVCQKGDANRRESHEAVARASRPTVRARGAVEGIDSVLRMHRARHRAVTRGPLDLKRLSRNCREFRGGRRRGQSPYELLGLRPPSYRFRDLLGMPTRTEGAI